MTVLSAPIAKLTTDGLFAPDLYQYLLVFVLVIVMFAMREYTTKGINHGNDHTDDLEKE